MHAATSAADDVEVQSFETRKAAEPQLHVSFLTQTFKNREYIRTGILRKFKVSQEMLSDLKVGLSTQATHTFNPGEMGIIYDDQGFVKEFVPDGQAGAKLLSTGKFRIVKVNSEKFSKEAILNAESSEAEYEVTFENILGAVLADAVEEGRLCLQDLVANVENYDVALNKEDKEDWHKKLKRIQDCIVSRWDDIRREQTTLDFKPREKLVFDDNGVVQEVSEAAAANLITEGYQIVKFKLPGQEEDVYSKEKKAALEAAKDLPMDAHAYHVTFQVTGKHPQAAKVEEAIQALKDLAQALEDYEEVAREYEHGPHEIPTLDRGWPVAVHVFGATASLINLLAVQFVFWVKILYIIHMPNQPAKPMQLGDDAAEALKGNMFNGLLLYVLGWIGPSWEATIQLIQFLAPLCKRRSGPHAGKDWCFIQFLWGIFSHHPHLTELYTPKGTSSTVIWCVLRPIDYILGKWHGLLPFLSQVKLFLLTFQASFLATSTFLPTKLVVPADGYTWFCRFVLWSLLLQVLHRGCPERLRFDEPSPSFYVKGKTLFKTFSKKLEMGHEELADRIKRVPGWGKDTKSRVSTMISLALLVLAFIDIVFMPVLGLCIYFPGGVGAVNPFKFATVFEDMWSNASNVVGFPLLVYLCLGPFVLIGLPTVLMFLAPTEGNLARWCYDFKIARGVLGVLEELLGATTFLAMWTSMLLSAFIMAQIADPLVSKQGQGIHVQPFKDGLVSPVISSTGAISMLILILMDRKRRMKESSERTGRGSRFACVNVLERWGGNILKVMLVLFLMGLPIAGMSLGMFAGTLHGKIEQAKYFLEALLLIPICLISQLATTKWWVVLILTGILLLLILIQTFSPNYLPEAVSLREACRTLQDADTICEAVTRSVGSLRKFIVRAFKRSLLPVMLIAFFAYWLSSGSHIAREINQNHYVVFTEDPHTYQGKPHAFYRMGALPLFSILMGDGVAKSKIPSMLGLYSRSAFFVSLDGVPLALDPVAINRIAQDGSQPDFCELQRLAYFAMQLSNSSRDLSLGNWERSLDMCKQLADSYFDPFNPDQQHKIPDKWKAVSKWTCPTLPAKSDEVRSKIIYCLAYLDQNILSPPKKVDEQQGVDERHQEAYEPEFNFLGMAAVFKQVLQEKTKYGEDSLKIRGGAVANADVM